MEDITRFATAIRIPFKNIDFLQQAVVHRSYLNEHPDFRLGHNERLEFLGDAVLELVVTEYLYETYPDSPEGDLTNWRASLVNATMLSSIGQDLGIEAYLYLSRGEAQDKQSKARQYILANAMEAIIGAIYLDQGIASASTFIHEYILVKLPYILEHKLYLDPKSKFQEMAQELIGVTPSYRVLSEIGPDHLKQFTVGVYLGDECITEGQGTSKQEAQVAAAEKAIEMKGW
ncbi:ribonuclease III [Candidatus Uhrbacteria bacterium]|nr:ribonuclease III [Candidatus Uhrbacteria bacterium]